MRREQSPTRSELRAIEKDELNGGILKINPLIDWSEAQLVAYSTENRLPQNRLYKQGYRSIGCAPCTRAVSEGEDARAGRWWWENPDNKGDAGSSTWRSSAATPRSDGDKKMKKNLTHLQQLEAESIHIIREVVAEFGNPVMLYSIGKDSAVMLHLARKAFYPAPPPFPLLHVDTTWKFREMIQFRDRMAAECGLDLIVHVNMKG